MTKNTSPKGKTSAKQMSNLLFQISAKYVDQASDTLLDPSMVRALPPTIVHTIMDSFSMYQSGLPNLHVQAAFELKRDAVNQTLSLASIPILTIYGTKDLSQSDPSTLAEQVIWPTITWISRILLQVEPKISISCLEDLVSEILTHYQYLTNSSLDLPYMGTLDVQSHLRDITEEWFKSLPEKLKLDQMTND